MQDNIARAMAATTDLRERKVILFQLWDEVAESGSPELVDGGDAARRVVIEFVRTQFVGVDAYTREELLELDDRKQSWATFDPYGNLNPPRDPPVNANDDDDDDDDDGRRVFG